MRAPCRHYWRMAARPGSSRMTSFVAIPLVSFMDSWTMWASWDVEIGLSPSTARSWVAGSTRAGIFASPVVEHGERCPCIRSPQGNGECGNRLPTDRSVLAVDAIKCMPELHQNHRVFAPQRLELADRRSEFGADLREVCRRPGGRAVGRRRGCPQRFTLPGTHSPPPSMGKTAPLAATSMLKTTPLERPEEAANAPDRRRKTPTVAEVVGRVPDPPSVRSAWPPTPTHSH